MMENLPYLFGAALGMTTLLAVMVIWARRRFMVRLAALLALTATLAVDYLALNDLLSRPKPIGNELFAHQAEEAQVIAATLAEGKAIYLLLRLADIAEPRYYAMPWQRDTAEQLQRAMREAEERRSRVLMRMPFEPSLEDREHPRFYALPQTRLPPKPSPDYEDYRHPSTYI